MIKKLINAYKENRKKKRLRRALSNPSDRLELMRAGYKKFSAELSERERARMKKEIKSLERAVKNWEKAA